VRYFYINFLVAIRNYGGHRHTERRGYISTLGSILEIRSSLFKRCSAAGLLYMISDDTLSQLADNQ
jgi:hypothetical protein